MEDIKIVELPDKSSIDATNHLIVEDEDGTKKVLVKHFRSLLISSLYFNNIEELKNSTNTSLKEGDICETLGYYTPGDGGGAKYRITYNPGAVEDGKLVHYLAYSDVLRAEIVLTNSINVHQFGAVGDGKTDDTVAIQVAMDNCDSRTVEFVNNKSYVIRTPIEVNKDHTIINGNGATICPYYVDGLNIHPANGNDVVDDITINKLHFDCSKATNGIYLYNSSKVDINSCKILNVTNTGINVKNSEFVNINYCKLSGQNSGSLVTLDSDASASTLYNRFINILDCDFNNFTNGINLIATGTAGTHDATVNIDNCNYDSNVNNCRCINVACPVEMVTVYSNTVTATDTFLYFGGASSGDISCRGISCLDTASVFDIGTVNGVLHLDGSIKVSLSSTVLFKNMNGKLRTSVSWDLLSTGANFTNKPIGEIYDSIHPYNYADNKGYSIANSKLTIREARNLHVDWSSSTNNINEIANGVKGQLIYIKSSTNKSIVAVANKIVLSDTSIKLGLYRGILLRFDGNKWIQIQYEDSTVIQTVSEELKIDYSKIEFDTTEIVSS
jgi:hypothetical protein